MNQDFRKGYIPNLQKNIPLEPKLGVRKIEEVKSEIWKVNHMYKDTSPLTKEEERKLREQCIDSLRNMDNVNRKNQ